MRVADAFAFDKVGRQSPRFGNEQANRAENLRIPIYELIENFENDVTKRAMIVDRSLAAFVTPVPVQFRSAIFAMSERQRLSIFASNDFFRLVGHRARLQKQK